jgi:hypothetical protein
VTPSAVANQYAIKFFAAKLVATGWPAFAGHDSFWRLENKNGDPFGPPLKSNEWVLSI